MFQHCHNCPKEHCITSDVAFFNKTPKNYIFSWFAVLLFGGVNSLSHEFVVQKCSFVFNELGWLYRCVNEHSHLMCDGPFSWNVGNYSRVYRLGVDKDAYYNDVVQSSNL